MLQCCAKKKEGQDTFFSIPSVFTACSHFLPCERRRGHPQAKRIGGSRSGAGSFSLPGPGRGEGRRGGGDTRKCWAGDAAFKIPLCVLLCICIRTFVHMQTASRASGRAVELVPFACTPPRTDTTTHKHTRIYRYRLNETLYKPFLAGSRLLSPAPSL